MKGLKESKTGRFKQNLQAKACGLCEVSFKPRHDKQKFCGRACMGKSSATHLNKRVEKVCEQCGTDYFVHKFRAQESKFCTHTCYFKSGRGIKRGADSKFWKGGVTPINKQLRTSLEYKLWRKAVFERDNYTCCACGILGTKLHAHHIKPFALFPELRLAIDNGSTLCVPCHKKTDTYLKNFPKNLYAI